MRIARSGNDSLGKVANPVAEEPGLCACLHVDVLLGGEHLHFVACQRGANGKLAFGGILVEAFGFGQHEDDVAVLVGRPVGSLHVETDGGACLCKEAFCRRALRDKRCDGCLDFVAMRLAERDNPERLPRVLLGVFYGSLCDVLYIVRDDLQDVATHGLLER